ncbi:MAG: glycosyltransferase [Lentimicrobiaceae bacterium]|jgi:glycosyltransferase involved in cell wall biosynthesis
MKILQINNYHYVRGGADRVYLNTGKLLEDHNHEVLYFSSLNDENIETVYSEFFVPLSDKRNANFREKVIGTKDYLYNNSAYHNLNKLIEIHQPDIAHLHLYSAGLSTSILRSLRKHHIPIVQTVHDYRLLCPANSFLDSRNNICEKCKNKTYLQCALNKCSDGNFLYSSVAAMEAYTRKYFINPLDYIKQFIFVSNFAQNKHIEFDKRFEHKSSQMFNFTQLPEQYSKLNKERYFLYFGRLSREKGIQTLLRAAKDANIKLKIAGRGPMQNDVAEYAQQDINVELLGHQSGNKLKKLIDEAFFIVVPSEWYENNPMTVIEAYALGKPVIGARIGGITEIVVESKTGYLFESRNSMDLTGVLKKAKDMTDKEYTQMSSEARKFAEINFSPERHYEKLMNIYTQCLKNA